MKKTKKNNPLPHLSPNKQNNPLPPPHPQIKQNNPLPPPHPQIQQKYSITAIPTQINIIHHPNPSPK